MAAERMRKNEGMGWRRSIGMAPALLLMVTLLGGCGSRDRVNMFEGTAAQDALAELAKKIGHPVRALKVEMTPLAFSVQVQDPTKPMNVDEYRLEHIYALNDYIHYVNITGPTAVQLNLSDPKLEHNLFDLDSTNIAATAAAAKEAIQRTGVTDGRVSEIDIQRQLFLLPSAHCGDVEWNISVKSDREYATAFGDAQGRIARLNIDGTNRAKNLDLFTDATELQNVIGTIHGIFGSNPSIKRLLLYHRSLAFQGRTPKKPQQLSSFLANLNGVFATAEPVISVPQAAGLSDSALFSVDDADWKSVPAMIEQAKIKIEIPDGQIVEPIILEKPTYDADTQPACWTVRVKDSDGENGEVTFDTKGKVVHVLLPKSRRPAVSMFDPTTARDTIAGIRTKFGAHAQLIELRLDEHRAIIIGRNLSTPGQLRDFLYEDDHFADFPGTDETPFYGGFDGSWFFDLDQLDATLLPKMAGLEKQTIDRLKLANAKIERVTISKQKLAQPQNQQTLIEIRVKGDGDRSGWVIYDLNGRVVSVMTP